ncbi:MAG TPA: hypothetical protein VIY48_11055, partial [Candidatus Paceibacterota bacterium]
GMQTTWQNGQPSSSIIPNYLQNQAAITGTTSGAKVAGAAPFVTDSVNTPGAPTLMTNAQKIAAATGRPMPSPVFNPGQPAQVVPSPIPTSALIGRPPAEQAAIEKVAAAGSNPMSVNVPAPGGFRLQDQGQAESQKTYGKGIGEAGVKVVQDAANAVQVRSGLQEIRKAAQNFTPGQFAPLKQQLAQVMIGLGQPEDQVNKLLGSAGDMQALSSVAIQMAGKSTRASDANPSQLQFLKTLESMPTTQRTPQGLAKIVDYMDDVQKMHIDKLNAQQQWLQTHNGDLDGFEASWNKQAGDMPYIWNQRATVDRVIKNSGNTAKIRRYNPTTGKIE